MSEWASRRKAEYSISPLLAQTKRRHFVPLPTSSKLLDSSSFFPNIGLKFFDCRVIVTALFWRELVAFGFPEMKLQHTQFLINALARTDRRWVDSTLVVKAQIILSLICMLYVLHIQQRNQTGRNCSDLLIAAAFLAYTIFTSLNFTNVRNWPKFEWNAISVDHETFFLIN